MDGYRKFADAYFQERSRFTDGLPETFTVLEGLATVDDIRLTERQIPAGELVHWASEAEPWTAHSTQSQSDIRIVEIGISSDRKLQIDSDVFTSIFDQFKLDRCIKYFQAHNLDGFYPFGVNARRTTWKADSVVSFFLNPVGLCHLAWSYDPRNCSTRGILMAEEYWIPYFRRQFILYQQAFLHPLFPGFVCMSQIIQITTAQIERELGGLSDAEELTGTNLEYNEPDTDFYQKGRNNQDLAALSKQIGSTNVAIAVNLKPMVMIDDFCEALTADTMGLGTMEVRSDCRQKYQMVWDDLAEAASVLQLDARSMIDIVRVVEKRVSLQLSIVSSRPETYAF
jgi:hypothetical protein